MARILIIDDSQATRSKLVEVLQASGHHVTEAVDGNDGYDKIIGDKNLEFVITDYNMPGCDGLTMLQRAKEKLGSWTFPVFVLTTESSERLKSMGKTVGVNAWVIKPFDATKLLAGITKALTKKTAPK